MSQFPSFCCPLCKGDLQSNESDYYCSDCEKRFPIVLGIPDFRVFPDSYIDFEDDYKKAKVLIDKANEDNLDFKGIVRFYWSITPEVSKDRAELFSRRMFLLAEKGRQSFGEIEELGSRYQPIKTDSLLEIGCGTGGFLVAAKDKFKHVVGTDIAFRWLVIARKRLEELGLDVPLVCCCSENLPFRDDSFDLTVAEDVLEHVREQETSLKETHRVLKSDGMLFIGTPNRFSVTSEPHVRVWGVGFLPRKWMNSYVKFVKGISYEHIRVLSFPELKKLLKKSYFADHHILLPTITEEELKDFSKFEKAQVALYELVKKIPIARNVLLIFGPFFHILCYAHKSREKQTVS
jgi:ubiquinone/menaquinone biosynthesis C-methylase UbiE/uncharacterized protein YbaR (Trm112 family)